MNKSNIQGGDITANKYKEWVVPMVSDTYKAFELTEDVMLVPCYKCKTSLPRLIKRKWRDGSIVYYLECTRHVSNRTYPFNSFDKLRTAWNYLQSKKGK